MSQADTDLSGIPDEAEAPEVLKTQSYDSLNVKVTYAAQARAVLDGEEAKWQLVTSEYDTVGLVCESLVKMGYLKRFKKGYRPKEKHHEVRVLRVARHIRAQIEQEFKN